MTEEKNKPKKKWKKGFLSSGLPLEFEIAKLLDKNEFTILPEYNYERIDAGQTKDFSIDLYCFKGFPSDLSGHNEVNLDLLIECKYRTRNVTWAFLPDFEILDYMDFIHIQSKK